MNRGPFIAGQKPKVSPTARGRRNTVICKRGERKGGLSGSAVQQICGRFSKTQNKQKTVHALFKPQTGIIFGIKTKPSALAGVAQWVECQPVNQRVASSIPSWDICLGCRLGPQWGMLERQPHTDVSLLSFPLPFSSLKINNTILKKKREKN